MSKRGAAVQITKDNDDEDRYGPPIIPGTWQSADEETLKKRVIRKAKRPTPSANGSAEVCRGNLFPAPEEHVRDRSGREQEQELLRRQRSRRNECTRGAGGGATTSTRLSERHGAVGGSGREQRAALAGRVAHDASTFGDHRRLKIPHVTASLLVYRQAVSRRVEAMCRGVHNTITHTSIL